MILKVDRYHNKYNNHYKIMTESPRTTTTSSFSVSDILNPSAAVADDNFKVKQTEDSEPTLTPLLPYRTTQVAAYSQPPPPQTMASMTTMNGTPYSYMPQVPPHTYSQYPNPPAEVGHFPDMRNPSWPSGYSPGNSNYSSKSHVFCLTFYSQFLFRGYFLYKKKCN